MTPNLNLLIALVMITGPEITAPSTPAVPGVPMSAFRAVSEALELIDERERRWLFLGDSYSLSYSLDSVRGRYADLRDAPRIIDADRLPSREFCQQMLDANRDYYSFLRERQTLFPREEWIAEAIEEAESLWKVWDTALDCRREYYSLNYRRRCLKDLRERIGFSRYYAGCLPGPIPAWRLRRIDE